MRGRRAALETQYEPRYQPLILTALPRTGSQAVLRTLAAHPQVVTYRPFVVESRIANYWMDVWRWLAEPSSFLSQFSPQPTNPALWWLYSGSPTHRDEQDAELLRLAGVDAVSALADFAKGRVDQVYSTVAASCGCPNATYFAEKNMETWPAPVMWELYPRGREIMLVRDFRDMLCSHFALSKRGWWGFDVHDEERYIDNWRGHAFVFARRWRNRSDHVHLLRYEDLILSPEQTIRGALGYLDLESDEETVDSLVRELHQEDAASERHCTSGSQEASIGRWQRDLSPELQDRCCSAFAEVLETFGYPV